ncbi:acyltransferase [Saccharopolyspora hattusasensis]|uniref:acyltransferase n=1 Tax=Saccharopolyspora hattusasensis TaxID=1128679 RepID=UPI003D95DE61
MDRSVYIGHNVKIQNYALIYHPAELGDGVFVGPGAVLTNDAYPRAVDPTGTPLDASGWTPVGVTVLEGASLGAQSVCVAPVVIGRWALVGAGAVVVRDVPDFAIMVGNPARRIGWVSRAGVRLQAEDAGSWRCPRTGARFRELDGVLHEEEV